jgi:hypothetical protein
MARKGKRRCDQLPVLHPMQPESTLVQASCLWQSQQTGTPIQFAVLRVLHRISTRSLIGFSAVELDP